MSTAAAYTALGPHIDGWKVFAKKSPLEGSAVLYLLQECWVALNFSSSSFQRFMAL